jgi:hypothetical protein
MTAWPVGYRPGRRRKRTDGTLLAEVEANEGVRGERGIGMAASGNRPEEYQVNPVAIRHTGPHSCAQRQPVRVAPVLHARLIPARVNAGRR